MNRYEAGDDPYRWWITKANPGEWKVFKPFNDVGFKTTTHSSFEEAVADFIQQTQPHTINVYRGDYYVGSVTREVFEDNYNPEVGNFLSKKLLESLNKDFVVTPSNNPSDPWTVTQAVD